MKFRTTILQGDKTTTGILVPTDVVEALGKGKRPPVRVTVNGYTYRSTVAVMGGRFMVGVSADVRKNAGVAGGDEVEIDMELDTEPREVVVPADLAAALAADADAQRTFEALSYSNKRRHVYAVEDAKTAETRQRRIDRSVSQLREGKG